MRCKLLILLGLVLSTAAVAADQAPLPPAARPDAADPIQTVRAATAKAVNSLYDGVAALGLDPRYNVGQFVTETGSRDELMKDLQRADQIGDPRWLDRYTCQVQLEIPSVRIAQALARIAGAHRENPITAAQVYFAMRDWPRTLGATGSATSAVALPEIRPQANIVWAGVDDGARQAALRAANASAIRVAMDSVAPVPLVPSKTIGDGLAVPAVGRTVTEWLGTRPITRVDFRDDRQVEVALAVDQTDFFVEVRSALTANSGLPLPASNEDWRDVEREFRLRFRPAVGRSLVVVGAPMTRVLVQMPRQAPVWVNQQVGIQGFSPVIGNKLQSSGRAEIDARAKLRAHIEAMPLVTGLTVGQAAAQNPRIADAVSSAVERARVYKSEFRADGTSVVYLMADMRSFWEELRR
jgi:hypothetical protein